MLERLEKFQEAYELDDEDFEKARSKLQSDLDLQRKGELNALLDWYETEIDLGNNVTEADIQKTIDGITRKGW